MKNINDIFQKLAKQLEDNKLSPMERKQKKREFITKLGYKYLDYNKAKWFVILYI